MMGAASLSLFRALFCSFGMTRRFAIGLRRQATGTTGRGVDVATGLYQTQGTSRFRVTLVKAGLFRRAKGKCENVAKGQVAVRQGSQAKQGVRIQHPSQRRSLACWVKDHQRRARSDQGLSLSGLETLSASLRMIVSCCWICRLLKGGDNSAPAAKRLLLRK